MLKFCRSKMATLEHDVCDVHGVSSWYRVFPTGGMWGFPHQPKICLFTLSQTNFHYTPRPSHQKSIQANKKISFLTVVIVPFLCNEMSFLAVVLYHFSFNFILF